MADEIWGRRSRGASLAITVLLGFFFTIFLSSLATAPADAATHPALASCPRLHLKSSGSCVRQLQRRLDDDHVSPHLRVDGIFGAKTVKAVKNFQHKMGLHADGIVGPQTLGALEEPAEAAGIPAPSNPGLSRSLHSASKFGSAIWRHMSPPVIAICAIIFVTFGAAALFGVRSVRITYGKRRLECDLERFPPQRIVDTQADVLKRYIDAQSNYPGQLPPPGDHIRGIERGSW